MKSKRITVISIDVINDEKLSPLERRHLAVARTIAGWFQTPIPIAKLVCAKVVIVEKHLVLDGVYSLGSKSIYLTESVVNRLQPTIETTIHEIAHHITGSEDDTPEHELEIDRVSEEVIKRVEAGEINNLLGDVTW